MGASVSALSISPQDSGYQLCCTFTGHSRAINVIRFSPNGLLLASGGDDSHVYIWSLRTDGTCVQVLKCTCNGSVTDIRWHIDGSALTLIFGCADGTVHFYHHSAEMGTDFKPVKILEAHSSAIEGLDYNSIHRRLATVASGSIKVWRPEKDDPFAMCLLGVVPSIGSISRNVHFRANGKEVMASYLDSHKVIAWSIEPWIIAWQGVTFTRIALSHDRDHILIDNLATGVDAYSIPNMVQKATYQVPATRRFPTQVTFGARGNIVVYGSDSGAIHIFDSLSTEMLQTLRHHPSPTGLVQTVTTYTGLSIDFIASGMSDEDFSIKIWAKKKSFQVQEQQLTDNAIVQWASLAVWMIILGEGLLPFLEFEHSLPSFRERNASTYLKNGPTPPTPCC